MSQPLSGLRVIDFSNTFAGANASLFLADFGAEVIHVEPPGGSPLREQAAFPMWTRGSKSIELDLAQPADLAVARTLAIGSDIFLETWRPGVAERLGLGYEDLSAENPGLIYSSVTGFGRIGPCSAMKGYEGLVMAKLGLFSAFHSGVLREGPAFVAVPFASWSAAQLAINGTLAALHEREASGLGQRVDTTLVQGVAAHDIWNWFLHIVRERFPGAYTAAPVFDEDGVPTGPLTVMVLVALSADGRWLQFSQIRPHLFKAFIKALGLDWMYEDPEWSTLPAFDDAAKRSEFWDRLLDAVRQKSLAEWQEIFEADPDVWAETYRKGAELLDHPQFVHLGAGVEIVDPDLGVIRQPGPLVRLGTEPPTLVRPAPRLDEHGPALRAETSAPRGAAVDAGHPSSAALDGVTVLELATFYAGPFGATLLADLGARVVKVEPIDGEPFRVIQPFPEVGGIKVLQGKESIGVDLATEQGREIVRQLAARADIVLQSFRAGVAQRLGIDADSLRAVNPDLVYLYASGYGPDGPCAKSPAFAPTIGAATGLGLRAVGETFPERPDLSLAEIRDHSRQLLAFNNNVYGQSDGFAALTASNAMLLGLIARTRSGIAQTITTTMLVTLAHALSEQMVEYAGMGELASPDAGIHGLGACYRLYRAADDWIFLAAPTDQEWDLLAKALGSEVDLVGDLRFVTRADRRSNDAALGEVLSACFLTRPAAEWERDLTAADVGCVVVAPEPVEAVLQSDHFGRASGFLADVVHPMLEEHVRLAPLVSLSRSAAIPRPGCLLGQHTDAILSELGYSAEEVATLREGGVVI